MSPQGQRRSCVMFAGGGTGGHVFPLIAVADAVKALDPSLELLFVGTERGMEARAVPERGYPLELMRVLPLRGGGVSGFVRGVAQAARSLPAGRALVRRARPAVVLSVGGYAAGPVSLAAWSLGVPLALLEPNSVIGLANRLVAPLAGRAYTAFPQAERYFRRGRVMQAGVPLRPGFVPIQYTAPKARVKLLVLGGSQGARTLNEAVPRALATLGSRVEVVHQCGRAHAEKVEQLYAELGKSHARVVPFIDDMPRALGEAELVIGRSGAGAVSEICAVGRPSLLVPYPYAAGDHQRHNAEALVRAGAAASVLDAQATPERLVREISRLIDAPETLASMAESARAAGRPEAARAIALDLLEFAGLRAPAPRHAPFGAPHGRDNGPAALHAEEAI
jgi:UDP-N-acetylglucosamine--N-acetylmuramyl-(pentapeptide) pyrophosphoryl-undecaprenol N-acetylglucosamine transferase